MELLGADVVVNVMQLFPFDEKGVAADVAAVTDDYAFGPALRNLHAGGEAEGAIERLGRDVLRHGLRVRVINVGVALFGELRPLFGEAQHVPRLSSGKTLYLPASAYHNAIISISTSRCVSARFFVSAGSLLRL
ncbi:MAG: hypothetical protein MPW14_03055 [Candidatus Manganitrophus sp.]|nr:MAG: hypothetical protein MPW14_03055 [Candidatus Manganitrophus sp.]